LYICITNVIKRFNKVANIKDMSKLKEVKEAQLKWDDTVTEAQVMEKFGISQVTLRKLRREGTIKNFRYMMPSSTGNAERPGKKPVYSLTEVTELFSPVVSPS
jgi:hypothetical protein